jgi:hypothetical protein
MLDLSVDTVKTLRGSTLRFSMDFAECHLKISSRHRILNVKQQIVDRSSSAEVLFKSYSFPFVKLLNYAKVTST